MPRLDTGAMHEWILLANVYAGHVNEVKKWLKFSNVNVNEIKTLKDDNTALHLAVRCYIEETDRKRQNNYLKIVELLLNQAADINICNKCGKSAVEDALLRGDINLIQLLIKQKSTRQNYQNLFFNSFYEILQNQTTYCLVDIDYLILLFFTVRIENEKGFKMILDEKPSLNVDFYLTYTNRRIIHYVIDRGTCNMIKNLVDHGCDIDSLDDKGSSPLHNAIVSKQTDKVLCLLKFGASVNLENRHGETALHLAVFQSNLEVTKKLLDMGIDVNIKSKVTKVTPLHLAVNQIVEKNNEIVKLLLENGADLNAGDYLGVTPFHTACLKGDSSIILQCLKFGVNLYSKCDLGNNALYYASQNRNNKIDAIKILLQYEFDVNSIIFSNYTLLQIVVCSKHFGFVRDSYYGDLIECLLEYNADVNVQDKRGDTPLSFALSKSSLLNNVVKLLVANLALRITKKSKVCEKNQKFIENGVVYAFYTNCILEISQMKMKISSNSNALYLDFLTKNIQKASAYFRNEEIVDCLKSSDLKCFPIYGSLLKRKMEHAETRALLLQEATIIFYNNIIRDLPGIILDHIFSYMNEIELRFLVEDFS